MTTDNLPADWGVPADPPSPLTAKRTLALVIEQLRVNGYHDWPDLLERDVLPTLDAARAPDAGLRAAAQEVVSRWFTWLEGEADQRLRESMLRLRAALASSPAPADADHD